MRSEPAGTRRLLNSWKEIASYLACDERTARRWERERGLPVYRPPGDKRGHVYAYSDELDRWLSRNRQTNAAPHATSRSFRQLRWAVLVLLVLTSVVAAWHKFLRKPSPVRARLVGQTLEVRDAQNRVLWRHTFPETLRSAEELRESLLPAARNTQIADLDGDGEREVLFRAAHLPSNGSSGPDLEEILCFSSRGRLLWRYRPEVTVRMGTVRFDGPWRFTDWVVTPASGSKHDLWASVVHWHWRPSFVVRLDASGRASVRFVQAGWIYVLNRVANHQGAYILAGGVNNEYSTASLAVLKQDGQPACSPQTPGSEFDCTDGPHGRPERYFLFPPSEIGRLAVPYNDIFAVEGSDARRLVIARETPDGLWAMYQFSEALEPESVALNYRFGILHRRYEDQGLLRHRFETCPQLGRPVRIRRWDAQSGWRTVEIPPLPGVRPDVYRPEVVRANHPK